MRKTIKIGSKSVDFEANASVILVYHQSFCSDYFTDVALALSCYNSDGTVNVRYLRTDLMAQIIYALAKCADKTLPPCEEWLAGFELGEFNVNVIFSELLEIITQDSKSVKKN